MDVKRLVWEHEKEELVCDPRFGGDHITASLQKAMRVTGLSEEQILNAELIPFETYAPGASLVKQRDDMYSLRSGILHGSKLMQLDQDLTFGWDPPWWNEYELHEELWGLSRVALRNWLKESPTT